MKLPTDEDRARSATAFDVQNYATWMGLSVTELMTVLDIEPSDFDAHMLELVGPRSGRPKPRLNPDKAGTNEISLSASAFAHVAGFLGLSAEIGKFLSNPGDIATWMAAPTDLLGGQSPKQALVAGRMHDVRGLACRITGC